MAYVPQDILDRIRALENEVRTLRGRAQIRPALNQVLNGDVAIGEGGTLTVRTPGGTEQFRVGDMEWPGGAVREFGAVIRREDGSTALALWNGSGTEGEPQVLRLLDARGHLIFAEDVTAGGLFRPHLAQPWHDTNSARWPSTTSTSYTPLQEAHIETEHPRLRVYVRHAWTGSASTLRVVVNGTTVATSAVGSVIDAEFDVPDYQWGQLITVQLQARAVSGSTTYATFTRLHGVGSA